MDNHADLFKSAAGIEAHANLEGCAASAFPRLRSGKSNQAQHLMDGTRLAPFTIHRLPGRYMRNPMTDLHRLSTTPAPIWSCRFRCV